MFASSADTLAATSTLYLDAGSGRIGIGTTTPQTKLSIAASDSGLNLLTLTNTNISGYSGIVFNDYTGNMQGFAGYGNPSSGVPDLFVVGAANNKNMALSTNGESRITILSNGYVGVGTTTPQSSLHIYSNPGATGEEAYTQLILQNAYGSGNFKNQISLRGAGAEKWSFGNDKDGYGNQDFFLYDAVAEKIRFYVDSAGRIGIGTTTPSARLTITDTSVSNSGNVILVSTSTNGDAIFRVTGSGAVYGDGAYTQGADYAEYFYTTDNDLQSGEVMCIEVAENNQVKRCSRGSDANVMGIVSTKPAVVGNYKSEYANNSNYVIVGLIGQIPAKVTTENGPIRPGDALTPASSTPGYAMRANPGDPTVGVALEKIDSGVGVANVLIARQNKTLTVEMIEAEVTKRIAEMEIEDEVQIMLEQAIENYNFDDRVATIANEQIAQFDEVLTIRLDTTSSMLYRVASSVDSLALNFASLSGGIDNLAMRLTNLESWQEGELFNSLAEINKLAQVMTVTEEGNIRVGDLSDYSTSAPDVAVYEIITSPANNKTALVINQRGSGDVADFRISGVSIVNIAQAGRVTIVGELLVDGRIMVCSGGACGANLDSAVDETMGDMGVEGKVVAGAFESYCEDGYIWVPGSSKYGTMPGFCVEEDLAKMKDSNEIWNNISQGEAQLTCQNRGDGYHLITENEWLTIAENILRVSSNDISPEIGLQLATSTDPNGTSTSIVYALSNGNLIYNLVGTVSQWTDQTTPKTGLVGPLSNDWQEYYGITDYKGMNIAPPYYYNSDNGIGKIKTGDGNLILAGFVRGATGIYGLDLSNSPTTATSTIGFRCAK